MTVKILCLHKITDKPHPSWPGMPLKTFEKLLRFVSKKYKVCLPNQIEPNTKKKQMILTFDDGFEDFYINAFPLIKKYNLPAVLNVVVKCVVGNYQIWTQRLNDTLDVYAAKKKSFNIDFGSGKITFQINNKNAEMVALDVFKKLLNVDDGKREQIILKLQNEAPGKINYSKMMSATQLKEVADNGIAVGSHSMSHPNLQSGNLTEEILNYEIKESKLELEKIICRNVDSFAFPNGLYNEQSIEFAKKSGYKYLFLVNNTTNIVDKAEEHFLLDRILIYSANHWKNLLRIKGLTK